jgi:hypothetical protein
MATVANSTAGGQHLGNHTIPQQERAVVTEFHLYKASGCGEPGSVVVTVVPSNQSVEARLRRWDAVPAMPARRPSPSR